MNEPPAAPGSLPGPRPLAVPPEGADAVVLLLHGGRSAALEPPTRLNLPARRMRPFAAALTRASPATAVYLARYRHRGWNGARADAARDAADAVATVTAHHPGLPVVLLGHSMGGRAALAAAGHPAVCGVVGLAPWCVPEDPVEQLAGRPVALLHADRDRMTDPAATWHCVARARAAGAAALGVEIPGGDHAMLRRAALWHRLAVSLVGAMLHGRGMPDAFTTALRLGGEPTERESAVLGRAQGPFGTAGDVRDAGRTGTRDTPGQADGGALGGAAPEEIRRRPQPPVGELPALHLWW